jgi:hypothetical protein
MTRSISPDQLAFIRKRGVTRCPPAASTGMNWGRGGPDRGQTEQEILRRMYELPEIPSPYVRLDGSKRSQRKGKSKYEL